MKDDFGYPLAGVEELRARVRELEQALQRAHDAYYSRRPLESVISVIDAALSRVPKEFK
jgi:hypothetical protein